MKSEKPQIEIADIFRDYGHLLRRMPMHHHKAVQAIKNCRTAVLGGHALACNSCEFTKNAYNSCRNRHCCKCGFTAQMKWIEKRTEELLDCQYFHVVFTLPSELREIILQNQEVCYNLLFKASSQTLKEVAATPKNLNAEVGCIGILHTWGQNLMDHPHIHFIVPGGGLAKDKSKWVSCKEDFLLPVKILSKVFKGKILDSFEKAFDNGKLNFSGSIEHLRAHINFESVIRDCAGKDFVVYSKKPFAGPQQVIKYLGQYTHRIAISNYRLVKVEDGKVYFKVRDRENPEKKKIMSLEVKEFMRRFLLHILPKGFVRIRHFGLLASRSKKTNVSLIRRLQGLKVETQKRMEQSWKEILKKAMGLDVDKCPSCLNGVLSKIKIFLPLLNSA